MADRFYVLEGASDPASRIERVIVESPSADAPEGKVLLLDGEPKPLSSEQVMRLSAYVRLRETDAPNQGEAVQWVDQPGVELPSRSTDRPPQPGATPDLGAMGRDELRDEVARVRQADQGALDDLKGNASMDDMRRALREHYAEKGV